MHILSQASVATLKERTSRRRRMASKRLNACENRVYQSGQDGLTTAFTVSKAGVTSDT
jgi:hypothetical protein